VDSAGATLTLQLVASLPQTKEAEPGASLHHLVLERGARHPLQQRGQYACQLHGDHPNEAVAHALEMLPHLGQHDRPLEYLHPWHLLSCHPENEDGDFLRSLLLSRLIKI
jgi:hypothetical protein